MKFYTVLQYDDPYVGGYVEGIFSTKEKAEEWCKEYVKRKEVLYKYFPEDFQIEEWEVDNPNIHKMIIQGFVR